MATIPGRAGTAAHRFVDAGSRPQAIDLVDQRNFVLLD